MGNVTGRFLADLLPGGAVQMQFVPNGWDGNAHPLEAETIADSESDLISFFEFTPDRAEDLITELETDGHAEAVISIDEGKVPALFHRRSASA